MKKKLRQIKPEEIDEKKFREWLAAKTPLEDPPTKSYVQRRLGQPMGQKRALEYERRELEKIPVADRSAYFSRNRRKIISRYERHSRTPPTQYTRGTRTRPNDGWFNDPRGKGYCTNSDWPVDRARLDWDGEYRERCWQALKDPNFGGRWKTATKKILQDRRGRRSINGYRR